MRIHHIAIRVRDLDACRKFYTDTLGLAVVARQEKGGELRSIWLRAGESVLMLERVLRGRGPECGSAHLLAFAVDDLDTWERRLSSTGVIIDDRTETTLYFRDPEGHRVALSRFDFSHS